MTVTEERPLAQGKRISVVSLIRALEAVTKASVPSAKALHPRWIQWVTSLTATDVDYVFDPKLQTEEFLQYELEYPVPANTLPIEQYQILIYTDGSAHPAVGTKHQYSDSCAVDAPDRRSERGGHPDRRPEYVKQKKDLPQSTIKKEEKTPQPQFKKKKVAALSAKNVSTLENTVEEQDVGSDTVRQRSRGHNMLPESERSSGCAATSDFIAVETAAGRVLPPDRIYDLKFK
ncbi:hypothetical protein NDU88_002028 [Pleurodeles waltl]|uniref:Uncharacterized protein n=1 Tax=Pleurodeles waltl TaxID=8319 RepID=A0AAV7LEH3_PLEWA|nr:hypothetical protein NDU88_002028 [Pleurodeles waltl]